MMGKMSREKGKRGELELVHSLKEFGFSKVYRSQQYCGSATSADVIGLPYIHSECKRTEKLSLYMAYEQAAHDATGTNDMPTVFYRRSRKPWLVTMALEDWCKLYGAYLTQQQKVNT